MKLPKVHIGRKKGADVPPMPALDVHGRIPADRVASFSSQGMSEPEIIRNLRSEGYSPIEVDTAMKEALRSAVRPSGAPRMAPPMPTRGFGPPEPVRRERRMIFGDEDEELPRPAGPMREPPFAEDEGPDNELELPRFPGIAPPQIPEESGRTEFRRNSFAPPRRSPFAPPPLPAESADMDEIEPITPGPRPASKEQRMQARREFEEIAEGVVEERMAAMEKHVDDIGDRLKEITVRMNNLQQALDRVQGERRGDIAEITDKIEGYKMGMSEVSSRMESVERTMKDAMTPMMQSLRSLSDAVKSFKEGKGR